MVERSDLPIFAPTVLRKLGLMLYAPGPGLDSDANIERLLDPVPKLANDHAGAELKCIFSNKKPVI
jgi:hypothetical protein